MGLDDAEHLQRAERLAERRPADAEDARELALGRQALAAAQAPSRMRSMIRAEICS